MDFLRGCSVAAIVDGRRLLKVWFRCHRVPSWYPVTATQYAFLWTSCRVELALAAEFARTAGLVGEDRVSLSGLPARRTSRFSIQPVRRPAGSRASILMCRQYALSSPISAGQGGRSAAAPWLTPQSRRPTTGPDSISALVAATACLISTPHTQSGALRSDNQTLGGRGWFGTVVAGFDYQFAGPFIAGVFGDGISPTFTASGKILIEERVDRSSRTGPGLQVYAPATCSRPTCSLIWRLHAVAFFGCTLVRLRHPEQARA
jgi:hypothetical protein